MTASDLILVTGASGYVGKWCVVKLLERGYRVRGTIRSAAKAAQVRETVARVVGAEAAGKLELVEADAQHVRKLVDQNLPGGANPAGEAVPAAQHFSLRE